MAETSESEPKPEAKEKSDEELLWEGIAVIASNTNASDWTVKSLERVR